MITQDTRERTFDYIEHLADTGARMHIDNRARWNTIFNSVAMKLTGTKPSVVRMFDAWDEQRAIAVKDEHMVWMETTIARIAASELDPTHDWME